MTDPNPTAAQTGAPPRTPPSALGPVYHQLSTDFYPWTEVIADLRMRAQAGQSLLFQAESPAACARFVWRDGQLLGGYSGARDLPFSALMRGLPRARVTLLSLSGEAAQAIWDARQAEGGQALQGDAATVSQQLAGQSGVLLGHGPERSLSYWQAGKPLHGVWYPEAGEQEWRFMVQAQPLDRTELVQFWSQVLALTHRRAALDEVWRQASLELAADHPALDPFTREIVVRTGELSVDPGVDTDELRPALLAAYRNVLERLGLRIQDLPLENLRQHEIWSASGLAEMMNGGRA
ncbi:hypothetical protein [Deinococcus radiophilus]|uniref:Uncharacterized protein n=1 Tax=Deinococcus radiophilus TaxID=32062 RepID=A0A3S0IQX1_9DEIO|nr:hypothetical protein [Deinococcus radiophilus]RTR29431.1 hypothetical protein EJ104_03315 [Deinococcus radiophilus]UFA50737.1 hypothetical protein LMT64_02185 [Deinococcus radiophilus]